MGVIRAWPFMLFLLLVSVSAGTVTPSGNTLYVNAFDELTSNDVSSYKSQTEVLEVTNTRVIGSNCFDQWTNLKKVTLGEGLTSIGGYAFCDCTSLASITLPNSLETIGEIAFFKCPFTSISLPDSLETIGYRAFCLCKFTSISLLDSLISIGEQAFNECPSLTSITIPSKVTSIEFTVFLSCTNLKEVVPLLRSHQLEGAPLSLAANSSVFTSMGIASQALERMPLME